MPNVTKYPSSTHAVRARSFSGSEVLWAESRAQGTGEYFPPLQFHAEIVEVEIGSVVIYRPLGEFRRAKSYCHLYGAQDQRQAVCGSPVDKVSDHGRHVMSSRPVPLSIRRIGQRFTLNLSRAETSSP
ncbi:hypothetical protein TNCV_3152241 [Trichonephila clavipes]|nr:hypothetical protein TNCV_3152241 [Trichonephila clavipes]